MILSYGAGFHGLEFSDPPNSPDQTFTRRRSLTKSLFNRNSITRRNTISESVGAVRPLSRRSLTSTGQYFRYVEPNIRSQESTICTDITPEIFCGTEKDFLGGSDKSSIITNKDLKQWSRDERMTSTFHLAHPAPTLTQTQKLLQIRPKLLLQLQLVSAQTRPKPSVDVLPSTVVVPRLANKLPRIFRGRKELGINDVIIVKSEDYETTTGSNSDHIDTNNDNLLNRDLMAVICQIPRERGISLGAAEIVLSDGTICVATPLPCGVYEIRSTDERACTMIAHWWPKRFPQTKINGPSDYSNVNIEQKFAFSIMGSNSQKNSIMATITRKNLKILDSYTTSPKSSRTYSPKSKFQDDPHKTENSDELPNPERNIHQIDRKMQTLIQVTGIWVALRQGWSPYFKYNDAIAIACSTTSSQAFRRERSLSLTHNPTPLCSRPNQQDPPAHTQFLKGISPAGIVRRTSLKGRLTDKRLSLSECQENPQRVVSAGAAFIQKAAARKASHSPTISTSDSYDEEICTPIGRATMERSSSSCRVSTSPRLSLPSYPLLTFETPVPKPNRPQSAYYPFSLSPCDLNLPQKSESKEVVAEIKFKHRNGRWKVMTGFTNFFRRMNSINSRSKYAS